MSTIGIIIPACLACRQLPRKLLLAETGKPLIQHTYEAAKTSRRASFVGVAADCREIQKAVHSFDGSSWKTSSRHRADMDRIAENERLIRKMDIVVSVRGDEPMIEGQQIDKLIYELEENPHIGVATLATPCYHVHEIVDPDIVKVVFDIDQRAFYFSRCAIPVPARFGFPVDPSDELSLPGWWRNMGIYAYRSDFLLEMAATPRCFLESEEELEQLRILHAGRTIHVTPVQNGGFAINTREDYQRFCELYFQGKVRA